MRIINFSLVAFALLAISCSSSEKNTPKWSPATYMTRTKETILDATPEKVFPLFCPVREYEYMREWSCTMKYSKSGYAEKNVIFQSGYTLPPGMKATWICTKFEPNEAITYTVFIPNKMILLVENTFEEISRGKTKHTVVYSGFGLNWLGKLMVKKMFGPKKGQNASTSFSNELTYFIKHNRKISK